MPLHWTIKAVGGFAAVSAIALSGTSLPDTAEAQEAQEAQEAPRAATGPASLPVFLRLFHRRPPRGRSPVNVSVRLRTGDGRHHTHRIAVAPDGKVTSNIKEILKGAPDRIGDGVALRAETFWLHRVVGLSKPVGVPLPRLRGE